MSVSGIMIGVIKRQFIKASQKLLKNVELSGEKLKMLEISDEAAVLINRLKYKKDKILLETTSRITGMEKKDLEKIVKKMNQTKKMADMAKGYKFKEAIFYKKNKLNIKDEDSIRDIIRKAAEYIVKDKNRDFNKEIRDLLKQIQNQLKFKVYGEEGAKNEYKKNIKFNINLKNLYETTKKYNYYNVKILETILKKMDLDIELYTENSGEELSIVKDKYWSVYSRGGVIDYINNIKDDVKTALSY